MIKNKSDLDLIEIHKLEEVENTCIDEPRIKLILRLIGTKKKVLEIGCKSGDITNEIFKRNNEVTGIDFVPDFIKLGRKKYPNIPFAGLYMLQVQWHLQQQKNFLVPLKWVYRIGWLSLHHIHFQIRTF